MPTSPTSPAGSAAATPPTLMVVVDTEEAFDWQRPVERQSVSVRAMAAIDRGQALCEAFGVTPVYVVDHPVAAQEAGRGPLQPIITAGRGLIGAHLHPWVSPPHTEMVTAENSFPGNLPEQLEADKLERLTTLIERSFGQRPLIYKAGRYGFGPNTAAILERLGYLVDLSPSPPFDFSAEGGPDFSRHGNHPTWLDDRQTLLCLPTTGAHVGAWPGDRQRLYRAVHRPPWRGLRLPGILSRLGLLARIRLSPEGFSLREMQQLTRALLRREVRVFTLSFHSPSLLPGCTPYVRDAAELAAFLERIREFLFWFFNEVGGVPGDPLAIRTQLLHNAAREDGAPEPALARG